MLTKGVAPAAAPLDNGLKKILTLAGYQNFIHNQLTKSLQAELQAITLRSNASELLPQ